jgi:hypothetical protein
MRRNILAESKQILGMPAMSLVFDSALTLAVIGAAITIGQISEQVKNNGQEIVRLQAQQNSLVQRDATHDVAIAENKVQYLDIVRRLESIDRKLEK